MAAAAAAHFVCVVVVGAGRAATDSRVCACVVRRRVSCPEQTYLQFMNSRIQGSTNRNPFRFRHITNLRSEREFEDDGPSVVLATPGMLQSGLSRRLFERWCRFSNNGVVLAGYSVKGTLAHDLLENPSQIRGLDGRPLTVKCATTVISFSGTNV